MTDTPTPDDDLATLRDFAGQEYLGEMPDGIYTRAADMIERLQTALREIMVVADGRSSHDAQVTRIAQEALSDDR